MQFYTKNFKRQSLLDKNLANSPVTVDVLLKKFLNETDCEVTERFGDFFIFFINLHSTSFSFYLVGLIE